MKNIHLFTVYNKDLQLVNIVHVRRGTISKLKNILIFNRNIWSMIEIDLIQ